MQKHSLYQWTDQVHHVPYQLDFSMSVNQILQCLHFVHVVGDTLDELTAIVDGYNSYFSFSKVKSGYSGWTHYAILILLLW